VSNVQGLFMGRWGCAAIGAGRVDERRISALVRVRGVTKDPSGENIIEC